MRDTPIFIKRKIGTPFSSVTPDGPNVFGQGERLLDDAALGERSVCVCAYNCSSNKRALLLLNYTAAKLQFSEAGTTK